MENIIACARELGAAIQESAEFQRLQVARDIQEADDDLQEKIQEFNLLRQKIMNEQQKDDKNDSKIAGLEEQAREMYEQIVMIPSMKEFMEAKRVMDKIMGEVNSILNYYITGGEGCGGCHSCDECGGN